MLDFPGKKMCELGLAVGLALVISGRTVSAGDGAGWRHNGTGIFAETEAPVNWSDNAGIVWKTPLAQWSNASPVLSGDRLFVCLEPATLACLSTSDGTILWQASCDYVDQLPEAERETFLARTREGEKLQKELQQLERNLHSLGRKLKENPEDEALKLQVEEAKAAVNAKRAELAPLADCLHPPTHGTNGYTSSTPATDGKRVVVLYGTGIVACYDMAGQRLWTKVPERPNHGWGHCASPLIIGDRVIVPIRNLFALDLNTGETVWQTPSQPRWGSPVLATIGDVNVIFTANGEMVRADDGKVLTKKLSKLEYCAPLVNDGMVYYIEHGGGAYQLPETVTDEVPMERVWTTEPPKERYYASPVFHDGILYAINQKSIFSAIDAADGKVIYSQELKLGGTAYPSIVLAGKLLYVSSDSGVTAIIKPGREFAEVTRNNLEKFRASPVVADGKLFIRGLKAMYCIDGAAPEKTD